jgi:hypothetical protein
MAMKPGLRDFLWMAAGAVVLLAIVLVALLFHQEKNTAAQLAFQAQRVELAGRMRLDLASASEAEKSAVLATTDQESQAFADQARAATAAVERERTKLQELLRTGGTENEKKLLAQFSQDFAGFQRVDKEVLDLAVQNTNLKAYALAFGPAAEALEALDAALSRLATQSANSAAPEAKQVMQLADDARIRAWRIQALLAPHIAEESDQKMDELEARMTKEDAEIQKDLKGLAALLNPGASPDLETATSRYAQFGEMRTQILKLSRANTNVRSLALSLNQKRKVMLLCQDDLAALEQAIQQEPVPQAPVSPR